MAIFNSYVKLPEGRTSSHFQMVLPWKKPPLKKACFWSTKNWATVSAVAAADTSPETIRGLTTCEKNGDLATQSLSSGTWQTKKKYVDHDLNGSTTWNWASKGWCQKFGQKCSNLDGKLLCWCLSPGRQTNGPWPKNPNDKKNQKIAVSLSFFQGAKMINPHPFPLIFKTTRNHGVELYAFILAPVSWYLIAIGGMVCVFGLSKLVSSFPTQQLLASLGFS